MKNKIKIIFGIIILLIIISCIYIFIIKKYTLDNIFYFKDKISIEVGDDVPLLNDYLYKNIKDNKNIKWNKLEVKDNKVYKVGTYTGKFKYKGKNKAVKLIVNDTISPDIDGVHDVEMLAYEKVPDFTKDVKVTDNSMEDIDIKIDGKYDSEKVGEYILTAVAKDSSGNEKRVEFKFTVKENKDVIASKSSKGYTIKNYKGITYVDNVIMVNKSYSLPSNFAPNNLVTINNYIKVVDFVKDAFDELSSDAKSIGLNIYASSGYRSYSNQEYIYNNYVKKDGKEKADTYSARAGYSEHQTGLAIDLNTIDDSFADTAEGKYIKDNCYKYGFIIRYPKGKESITGYMYEPWHIRYVGKELASKLYNNGDYITMEEYYGIDSKYK